ncbi:hypothetical protein, conserved [Plasmodium vivax]|uniref:tRNA pseudouridine(55) synthase n=3 Tax=Plasmodium vivax TaxID=5855 RepID=A5K1K3_PLAVS|nr:hypothetical protein, conserved [Plasmodium vivax]EDL47200.1 hypothetical protein, conserved [Plasmodium vivax]KMZ84948.1 hypothetical protein PVBG_05875 [Plasmodium vivax Brazil I]SCO69568.1 conserved Plasmodium protein, unknown function [Plasmodium vivax]|eukprot:XP_001616927.1 hypothetical protein [Plasmodium vivax Sal-1]
MENICYRCSISGESLSDQAYLFFDGYFLNDFNHDTPDVKANQKSNIFLDNDKKRFSKYVEDQRISTKEGDLQNVYKKVYTNLYLCKMCNGLHNIDLILFYNKNSAFHHEVLKENSPISAEEEKNMNSVFNSIKSVLHLLNSIDIVFFFLYLHKTKQIFYKEENVTHNTFHRNCERIKKYILIPPQRRSNNFSNKQIRKIFAYFLIYFYLTFYHKICDGVSLSVAQTEFVINLYKQAVLIFNTHTGEHEAVKTNQSPETAHRSNSRRYRRYNKKRKITNGSGGAKETAILHNEEDDEAGDNDDNNLNDCFAKNEEETEEVEDKTNAASPSDERKNRELAPTDTLPTDEGQNRELDPTNTFPTLDVYISLNNLCICGYYNKYNKEMSQTKWFINNESQSALSVEECIYRIFKKTFRSVNSVFMASGREDKDVRMMSIGRPFVFVLKETKFSFLNFYLFFSNLKRMELTDTASGNSFEVKTIDQINLFLQQGNCADDNSLRDHMSISNEGNSPPQRVNDSYALLNKKDTISLYDLDSHKVLAEQTKGKTVKEQKIHSLNLSRNYNKELEVLLTGESIGVNEMENFNPIDTNDAKGDSQNGNCDLLNGCVPPNQATNLEILKKDVTQNANRDDNINNLVDVKFSNVAFSTNYALIKKIMKYGEERKKAYKCIIYHSSPMTKEKIEKINQDVLSYDKNDMCVISVMQKTPIRVLHRRSLLKREKKIFEFNLVFVHEHFSLLYLLAQSGMYIKEFVNGDRGRTFPNLKHFFGQDTFVNILNLDVSSFTYDLDVQ